MARTLDQSLDWVEQGTGTFLAALARLDDDALDADSALPGWTRKHLVGHLGHNALALRNLASWAATGVENPMYASPQQRNEDIEDAATRPAADLRGLVRDSAAALQADWEDLSPQQWDQVVRTAQGRTVPASQTPWMRAREVMVHTVDLSTGNTFGDLDEDFVRELIEDILAQRGGRAGGPAVRLRATDGTTWDLPGDGEPAEVSGSVAGLGSWLAGRDPLDVHAPDGGPLPELGRWL